MISTRSKAIEQKLEQFESIRVGINCALALTRMFIIVELQYSNTRKDDKELYGFSSDPHSFIGGTKLDTFFPLQKPSKRLKIDKIFTKTNFGFILTDEGHVWCFGEVRGFDNYC
jgi:hypothetical protein